MPWEVLSCHASHLTLNLTVVVLYKLFLIFVVVPFIELAMLLYLAEVVGGTYTLAIIIATGLVGSLLAKSQGWRTYRTIQLELAAGRMPGQAMLDAVLIFVAGALLVTPGIFTDAFGLSLLIPPCRAFYRRRLVAWFKSRFTVHANFSSQGPSEGWGRSEVIDSQVITDEGGDER